MGRPDIFILVPKLCLEKFLRWHRLSSLCGPPGGHGGPPYRLFSVPKFNLGTRKTRKMAHLHTAPWLPELTMRL